MKCDSVLWLTGKQFDSVVNKSLVLLNTKKLSEISIDQHQDIIRSYNTIWMSQLSQPKYAIGNYAELKAKLDKPGYTTEMIKLFPGWTPNKGMGIYFQKLNVEFGGTPCSWSRFSIKK